MKEEGGKWKVEGLNTPIRDTEGGDLTVEDEGAPLPVQETVGVAKTRNEKPETRKH